MFLHISTPYFYLIAIIGTMQNTDIDIPMLPDNATTEMGRRLLVYIMVDNGMSAEDLSGSK